MLVHYSIKGIKKGHKKYKERQAEKERKLLEERGQLPDIRDPSRELDTTCLVTVNPKQTPASSELDRANSTSTNSTSDALSALDNDPDFQQYMERQRQLYIQNQRQQTSPPSYNASIQQTPISPQNPLTATTTHTLDDIAELPADTDESSMPVEIGGKHISEAQQPVEADSTPIVFELPGNLPAIMPEAKPNPASKSSS